MRQDEGRIRVPLTPASVAATLWRMDEPTNKPADSAASGEATPETTPPSGGGTRAAGLSRRAHRRGRKAELRPGILPRARAARQRGVEPLEGGEP